MVFKAASRVAHAPSAAERPGAMPASGEALAALFRVTVPMDQEGASHRLWLFAFILAGAVVRFWGLGAVGLHGDEETMAMAVRHILIDGRPILPGGMFYPRGLTQLYLMAASAWTFGESEWALRLPSAICGVALIPLAHLAGRRFLRPRWNLALAASVAFLPVLIVDSQTARMYIFLVALIVASTACLFAWERTGRMRWLIGSVAALILGLDMHALAVGAVLIFLFPGLLRGDMRRLALGCAAALTVVVAYSLINGWVEAQYPPAPTDLPEAFGPAAPSGGPQAPRKFDVAVEIALSFAGVVLAFFAWRVVRAVSAQAACFVTALLLAAAIVFQLALFYHLAILSYVLATVVAVRFGSVRIVGRLAALLGVAGALGLVQASLLAPTSGSFVRLAGAMLGYPSVWPYVKVVQLSPAAGLLLAAAVAWGPIELARRRCVADYWLFAVLGVWAPVFALGLFAWNVPPRYTEMSLAPMLLCALAAAQRGVDWLFEHASDIRLQRRWEALAALLTAALIIDPASAAATINAGYRMYPDHKGAAEFMRTQNLTREDIVLAEDVLQQTYYLGRVDYWIIGPQVARRFIKRAGDGWVDFYTGTPVIVSTQMLDRLLRENRGRRIFVIGSGEGGLEGRRDTREDLDPVLQSARFVVVYTGRDGLTQVLRATSGAADDAADDALGVSPAQSSVVRPPSAAPRAPVSAPVAPPGIVADIRE